jgi:hypothetical protein
MEQLIDVAAQTMPNLMSVLVMFIQERRHQKGLTQQQFIEWLETHHFEELKRVITTTHGLEREIDLIFKAQQDEILSEMKVLTDSVGLIASRMEILGGVSRIVSPRVQLSEQALWMIRLLDKAVSYFPFMSIETWGMGIHLRVGCGHMSAKDARFIREDFADLFSVGFISKHSTNDRGEPVFGITRLGTEYVKTLPALPEFPEEDKATQ